MKYRFSTTDYKKVHLSSPYGRGHWAFLIKNAELPNIAPETFIDHVDRFTTNTIFWVEGVWTYTEAKERASVLLAANAVPAGTTIYTAP